MPDRDYYDILGVPKNASQDEIKASFRRIALKYHPDRNPDEPNASDLFKEAANAYEVLSDPDKRARYDRFGHAGVRSGSDFHNFTDVNDIFSAFNDLFGQGDSVFSQFFGGARQSRHRNPSEPGADLRVRLPLTLEEIASGCEKTIRIRHWKHCETCNTTGSSDGPATPCSHCQGSGEIREVTRSVFGQFMNIGPCGYCGGTGFVIENKCPDCEGEGRQQGETTIKVTVPAGVRSGNYLTVSGKGHAGRRGGSPGDAMVVMEEIEHEVFSRQDDDLYSDVQISFPVAALGGEVEVLGIEGKVMLTIDAGTQPETMLRLKGKGIPHLNARGRGDHFVRVHVFVPVSLSKDEKALIRSLAESKRFEPKADSRSSKEFFNRVKEVFS